MRSLGKVALLLALVGTGTVAWLSAQNPPAPTPAKSPEEDALRTQLKAYADAYRAGDLEKLSAYWSAESEFIDLDGTITKGKDAILKLFRESMKDAKLEAFEAKITSLRIVRGDLAFVDGTATATLPNAEPEMGAFQSIWAKTNGQWQIVSVRDVELTVEETTLPSSARLRTFDPYVGEWSYTDNGTTVTMSCKKTLKDNFFMIEQVVKVKGEEKLSLVQMVGWDPLLGDVHSWMFDSAGGYGESIWELRGNEWLIDAYGVRPDGRTASSINSLRFVDKNTIEWSSSFREVDGEELPDLKVRYTRVAAK